MTNSQNVLTLQKCPLSEGLKFKIILRRVGKHEHTDTYTQAKPSFPSLPAFLCPVSVMDGESVAYSCIQLTNCPSPIMAPLAVWFVRDGTRQDESAAQIEKGHRGYRQTKKVHLKKIIYLRAYRPLGCGWAAPVCECTYAWVRLEICETRFSNDLAV